MEKNTIYLIKKAIEKIIDTTFCCDIWSGYDICADGGSIDYTLSRKELLYLIFEAEDVFGEKTQKIDLVEEFYRLEKTLPWCSKDYEVFVEFHPSELYACSKEICKLYRIETDEQLELVKCMLKEVGEGEYTVIVDRKNNDGYREIGELKIHLTTKQALSILRQDCPKRYLYLFDDLCDEFDEYFSLDWIAEQQIKTNKNISYNGGYYMVSSQSLYLYINSWKRLIEKIKEGVITKVNLEYCLKYFDEKTYEEILPQEIDSWIEYSRTLQ